MHGIPCKIILTIPIILARTERSFLKLKLFKSYLQSAKVD